MVQVAELKAQLAALAGIASAAQPEQARGADAAQVSEAADRAQRLADEYRDLEGLRDSLHELEDLRRLVAQLRAQQADQPDTRPIKMTAGKYQVAAAASKAQKKRAESLAATNKRLQLLLSNTKRSLAKAKDQITLLLSFPHVENKQGELVMVVSRASQDQGIALPTLNIQRRRLDRHGQLCGGVQYKFELLLLCIELAAVAEIAYDKTVLVVDTVLRGLGLCTLSRCATARIRRTGAIPQ